MKSVIYNGIGDISVENLDAPRLQHDDDVIVRVTAASICGTDIRFYWGTMLSLVDLQPGTALGHEFVGVVEEVGSAVHGLRVGQRVVSPFSTHCGTCYYCEHDLFIPCEKSSAFGCGKGWGGLGGAQAEYVRVPHAERTLLALDERVSDEHATVLPDVLTGVFAGLRFLQGGESVAVFGCGPTGLAAVMCARLRGAGKIFAIDHHADRLARAERAGAIPIDFDRADVLDALRSATGGRGVDVGVEAVGKIGAFAKVLPAVRRYGSLVMLGFIDPSETTSIGAISLNHVTIRPALIPSIRKFQYEVMNLIADGRLDPATLLSHTLPLAQAGQAYAMMAERRDGAVKIVLKP